MLSNLLKKLYNIIFNLISIYSGKSKIKKTSDQITDLKIIREHYLKNNSITIFVLDKYKWVVASEPSLPDVFNEPFNQELIEFLDIISPDNLVFLSKKSMWRLSHSKNPDVVPEIFASTRYVPKTTTEIFENNPEDKVIVVLDGVNDPRNIGAIVRILEGLGNTSAVIFTENTTFVQTHLVPGNRFTLSRQYGKTSVGTYKVLPTFKDTISNIGSLAKKYDYQIIVIDNIIDNNIIQLENLNLNPKTILVFGSENFGVSKQMLELKNQLVEIPMEGIIQSLNVQTAVTIVAWHCLSLTKK